MVWWALALVAVLSAAAAGWLHRRTYRYPDDVIHRTVPAWLLPVVALAGATLAIPFAIDWSVARVVTMVVALVWAVILMFIDLDVRRLPDVFTLPGCGIFAAGLVACSWAEDRWAALGWAALCAVAAAAVFLIMALLASGSQGLGLGDVKLAGVLGLLLGWLAPLNAVLGLATGFIVGGLCAALLLVTSKAGRKAHMAFGPAMIIGAYVWVLLSPV